MTALSDLLAGANTDKLSTRELADRTERAGRRVGHATIAKYLNGTHGTPDDSILRVLAEVLPVKLSELREAAGVPRGARGPYTPPDVAHRLDDRQRAALDELIRSMVDTSRTTVRSTDAQQSKPTKKAPPKRGRLRAVDDDTHYAAAAYRPDEPPAAEQDQPGDDGGA